MNADTVAMARAALDALRIGQGPLREVVDYLSTPPADDVREAAERHWPVMVTGYTDSDGSRFEYESDENRRLREAFVAGTTFEVRSHGTVTDAEVEAAALCLGERFGHSGEHYIEDARAALEASRKVHP